MEQQAAITLFTVTLNNRARLSIWTHCVSCLNPFCAMVLFSRSLCAPIQSAKVST